MHRTKSLWGSVRCIEKGPALDEAVGLRAGQVRAEMVASVTFGETPPWITSAHPCDYFRFANADIGMEVIPSTTQVAATVVN
jgi:hypothetical protein